ncbi:hypothetical protein ACH4UM_18615 [Streptomyces sp. NPDC020801]|uniref:hypothetical protein n=1 Tax=Streptomyces sp. NPDC020801 TaxID=3365093 RepID=UPI00378EED43
MNARERLEAMIRTDRGNMTVWSAAEVRNALRGYRAEVLYEAAEFVGNDDSCDCGGCDTCLPRKLADELRAMADQNGRPAGLTAGGEGQ